MPRGGLSSDPVKRRRQLEALARGSEARAATLRAMLAEPDPSEPASAAKAEPVSVAEPEPASGARSGAVRPGRYGDPPPVAPQRAPQPAPEPEPDPDPGPGPAPEPPKPDPEPEPEPEPEPSGLVRFGAGLLGVKPPPDRG